MSVLVWTGLVSNEKMVLFPTCLNVLQNAWVLHCINKDEGDESMLLLAFRRDVANEIILKCSKEDRLSSSHVGI